MCELHFQSYAGWYFERGLFALRQKTLAGLRVLGLLFGVLCSGAAHADLLDLTDHSSFKKIYFIPAPTARAVKVDVFLPIGEIDRTGPEGLAHYLEHLVLWSADKVHGEGVRNRTMNAWTSPYWTAYWNQSSAEAFEDMIRNARAVFEPVELSNDFMLTERDVVEREFDLRYRDNPMAVLYDETYHHLYGSHALGRSVMGHPESIQQITAAKALAFHQRRYRAQDAYVLIYGPVTKDQVIAQIEKHLSDLPQPEAVERGFMTPLPQPPKEGLTLHLPKLTRDTVLFAGQAAPPSDFARRKLWFTLLLLGDVLNSTQHGGLAKPLYFDSFTVTGIQTSLSLLPMGDIRFEVSFRPEDDVSTQDAIDQVHHVMQDLAANGLPAETVNAIRRQIREEVRRLEKDDTQYQGIIARSSILNLGKALDVKAYHYELSQPTVEDLNLVLRTIVESQFKTTAIAHPEKPNA